MIEIENQEFVFEKDKKRYRVDVFINNTIYEFQHIHISEEEFNEHNNFYNGMGYKVIWVFDRINEFKSNNIELLEGSNFKIKWEQPIKAFANYRDNEMFQIYLQDSLNSWTISDLNGYVNRVSSRISYCTIDQGISDIEFICNVKNIPYVEVEDEKKQKSMI